MVGAGWAAVLGGISAASPAKKMKGEGVLPSVRTWYEFRSARGDLRVFFSDIDQYYLNSIGTISGTIMHDGIEFKFHGLTYE
jgi:hypothetical protein